MSFMPKSPVDYKDPGAVIGFVLAVAVAAVIFRQAARLPVVGPILSKLN